MQFLHKSDATRYPSLTALAKPVKALWHIVADIRRIIDDNNTVRDGASPELREIRQQIRRHEGQVSKRLQAILQAAKLGISIDGATLYCTHQPCSVCAKMIINVGIKRVIYQQGYPDPFSLELFQQAGVLLERFEEPLD